MRHEQSDSGVISTDILIIGFGFSIIPLIRELERDHADYVIVSSGDSIWDRLEKHARLDFDMVSSMHTSLYSFELVKRDTKDRYLPVKEYQAFIKQYLTEFGSNVIEDRVISVDNYVSHSTVRTQGGKVFVAKHLVCATAFQRRMNHLLNDFDFASAKNKTIAITAIGDSVNLMISKMVPYDNRIVLVTNGAVMLDKLAFYDGISYTLDQLEYHNVRHISNGLYRKTFFTGSEFVVFCQTFLKFLRIDHVYYKYPLIRRRISTSHFLTLSPVSNGHIAIKYWPIDTFKTLFDNGSLKHSIEEGYLLNDLPYFLERGLVELWPKSETSIDREQQTIQWKDQLVKYDFIVDADYETPNLPEIIAHDESTADKKYEYVCRNCFLGLVPKELRNVYFIGYIRPTTGGLNNITEMQCLFAHKMITDSGFHQEIYQNIEGRIRKYNRYNRPSKSTMPTDHLVPYGFYTDDVATAMKINSRVWDCRSLRDILTHFFFPNTAFKFRQSGSYKVEGVKEMVHKIYNDHNGFSIIRNWLLTYALLQFTAYVGLIMTWYQQPFYFPTLVFLLLLLIVWFNPVSSFVASIGFGHNSYVNIIMILALGLTVLYPSPAIPLLSLVTAIIVTYLLRKLGWSRMPFNDLKNKMHPKYHEFFDRYCKAFREVFSESYAKLSTRGKPIVER